MVVEILSFISISPAVSHLRTLPLSQLPTVGLVHQFPSLFFSHRPPSFPVPLSPSAPGCGSTTPARTSAPLFRLPRSELLHRPHLLLEPNPPSTHRQAFASAGRRSTSTTDGRRRSHLAQQILESSTPWRSRARRLDDDSGARGRGGRIPCSSSRMATWRLRRCR